MEFTEYPTYNSKSTISLNRKLTNDMPGSLYNLLRTIGVLLILSLPAKMTFAERIYKSIDEHGDVTYSATPPKDAVVIKKMSIPNNFEVTGSADSSANFDAIRETADQFEAERIQREQARKAAREKEEAEEKQRAEKEKPVAPEKEIHYIPVYPPYYHPGRHPHPGPHHPRPQPGHPPAPTPRAELQTTTPP